MAAPISGSIRIKMKEALRAKLDAKVVESIVSNLVSKAVNGDQQSVDALIRLLEYQRASAAF